MKKLFNKIIAFLDRIEKDKYQHFALGAVIAIVTFLMALFIFSFSGEKVSFWVSFSVSVLTTSWLEVFKEQHIDSEADRLDVIATLLGGVSVWAALVIGYIS